MVDLTDGMRAARARSSDRVLARRRRARLREHAVALLDAVAAKALARSSTDLPDGARELAVLAAAGARIER